MLSVAVLALALAASCSLVIGKDLNISTVISTAAAPASMAVEQVRQR